MKPIYKIGDVLEINIDDNITNCIVIGYEEERDFIIGDRLLRYEYCFASLDKNILKTKKHIVYVFVSPSSNMFHDCYQLLVGDKKLWIYQGISFREHVDASVDC